MNPIGSAWRRKVVTVNKISYGELLLATIIVVRAALQKFDNHELSSGFSEKVKNQVERALQSGECVSVRASA
jgi:hypothetical protein